MKRKLFWGAVGSLALGLLLTMGSPQTANAYRFYSDPSGAVGDGTQNCAACHGEFRAGTYAPPSGAPAWGGHLHAGHLDNTTIGGSCDNCHGGTGSIQRGTNLASSGNAADGVNAISCSGCHGRLEDANGVNQNGPGWGAGLRQHHQISGIGICLPCHADSDPAAFTPVGENVMPAWYSSVTNLVAGTTLAPCNENGEEDFESSPLGNDNDGDGVYDTADPDCAPPEDCFNGVDDSGNGLVDCEDPACAGATNGICDTGNLGVCQDGTLTCDDPSTPLPSCVQDVQASTEGPPGDATCSDTLDNDCNGLTDLGDPNCVVAGEEICFNGIDDSGNGLVDCEDPACYNVANTGEVCDSGLPGECQAGTPICNDTGASPLPDCVQNNQPVPELCDGLDNDCDGAIDNGFPVGDPCTAGTGNCEATGNLVCTADGTGTECDAIPGTPGTEGPQGDPTCSDTEDNDCDGLTDLADPNCSVQAPTVPPVNQNLGIMDVDFSNLMEDDCRACHGDNPPPGVPVDTTYLPDRHHMLVDTPIDYNNPSVTIPNPDADGDGVPDTTFDCLNCHNMVFDTGTGTWELDPNFRDCLVCHVASPHHVTPEATGGDCQACHGSLVDNGLVDADGDGQEDVFDWLPTYQPSLVTPYPGEMDMKPNGGEINPNNGVPEGNCQYCHDEGTIDGLLVQLNSVNHHNTGFFDQGRCDWCHSSFLPGTDPRTVTPIRTCENCHGIPSLHNIQAKSDGTPADGTITPGAENPYFGHIGSQIDCNGCHGFTATSAPGSGPVIPQIDIVSPPTLTAGEAVTLNITGRALTNLIPNPMGGEGTLAVCELVLEASDGSQTVLTAASISESSMTVNVPALAADNYTVRAKKYQKISNPMILPVMPAVIVDSATCSGNTMTIAGSGFGSYIEATDGGTNVIGTVTTTGGGTDCSVYSDRTSCRQQADCSWNNRADVCEGGGSDPATTDETGSVSSWSDTQIVADFSSCPTDVTVNSVYGSSNGDGGGTDPPTGSCSDYNDEASCTADSSCEWTVDKKGRESCEDAGGGGGKPPKDK